MRLVVAETGVLKGKTRRALDSTLLDDAVATQDTVTQLVSMIRRVRAAVAAAAEVEVKAHDYAAGGKPACAWDDPAARDELVTGLVADARAILDRVDGEPLDDDQAQLVALLALVAGQDVEPDPDRGEGAWRIARRVAKDRVISTVDPETRHMHKSRAVYRDGYKAHVAVEPDTGIITGVELTPANAGDGPTGVALLAGEEPGLEVLADSAYGSGQVRHDLATARADWAAGTGLDDYRQHRPMVERSLAWLVANNNRRVRYRGVDRNRLGLSTRAAVINLRRLLNLGLHHGPQGWNLA